MTTNKEASLSITDNMKELIEMQRLLLSTAKRNLEDLKITESIPTIPEEQLTVEEHGPQFLDGDDVISGNKENLSDNPNNNNKSLPYTTNIYKVPDRDQFESQTSRLRSRSWSSHSKDAFIERIVNAENPLLFNKSNATATSVSSGGVTRMLRYGEYSPNNPQVRAAAPYLGLGEYDQRRSYFQQRQREDYLEHLNKQLANSVHRSKSNRQQRPRIDGHSDKSVQTELKNIQRPLVQYELDQRRQKSPTPSATDTHTQFNDLSHPGNPNPYISSPVAATATAVAIAPSASSSLVGMQGRNYRSSHLYPSATTTTDQILTSAENAALLLKHPDNMDGKPKSILSNRRTGSPRERLVADLKHSYSPAGFFDGFSYQDRSEELERERAKRENYQRELMTQIEEKRRLQNMREEQERLEQELENRRLEQHLLRMQEQQMRRHSEDLVRRKQDLQSRPYRKHVDSESSVSSLRNTTIASQTSKTLPLPSSHYSPPVSRRRVPYSFDSLPTTNNSATAISPRYHHSNTSQQRYDSYNNHRKDILNRIDSLHSPHTYDHYQYHQQQQQQHQQSNHPGSSSNGRYDSLSRIDALNKFDTLSIQDYGCCGDGGGAGALGGVQRRHSATQQDLRMAGSSGSRRSPKLQRRSSSGRFDDSLPIPVLKAHSPVARELKNSIPFNSYARGGGGSDALRKMEEKWQVPAVQKNVVNHDGGGDRRSILTQLGAIRMQLQQEQLRSEELRNRDYTQSKAVDFH